MSPLRAGWSALVLFLAALLALPEAAVAQGSLSDLLQQAAKARGQGKYAAARELCQQVLDSRNANDSLKAWADLEMGRAYRDEGDFQKAKGFFQESVKLYESLAGNQPSGPLGIALHGLGLVHFELRAYGLAEETYKKALKRLPEKHSEIAAIFRSLGALYFRMARYDDAEEFFNKSLTAFQGRDAGQVASILSFIGAVYAEQEKHQLAEAKFQESLGAWEDIVRAVGKEKIQDIHRRGLGDVKLDLAWVAFALGKFETSEKFFRASLRHFESMDAVDQTRIAKAESSLGWLLATRGQRGDYAEAEKHYTASLRTRLKLFPRDHPDVVLGEYNLALLRASRGQWAEAVEVMQTARRSVRRYLAQELPFLPEEDQLDYLARQREDYHAVLSLGLSRPDDGEMRKKLLESSAEWLLNHKGVSLETLAIRNRGEANRKNDPWVSLEEVQKQVRAEAGPNAVLLEFARFGTWDFTAKERDRPQKPGAKPRYAVWVIPAAGEGSVRVIELGPAAAIDAAISQVRKDLDAAPKTIPALKEKKAEEGFRDSLGAVAKLVLNPLRAELAGKDHLIISPDGPLWQAPWAALPLDDTSYAVEKFKISLEVSGRDLLRPAPRVTARSAVVFGNPEFGNPAASTILLPPGRVKLRDAKVKEHKFEFEPFEPLKGAKTEVTVVTPRLKEYTGSAPIVRKEATATRAEFLRLDSPQVLFVTTHGYCLQLPEGAERVNPMKLCGLAMAGANTRKGVVEDVVLGEDIVKLDLRGTDLVLMSACETARGKILDDEGVRSLQQAFHLAGARTVIGTQWSIPDKDTPALMNEFFKGLIAKKDKAEALRQAQLAMIKFRREEFGAAHPFFWAAFTLTGDWK